MSGVSKIIYGLIVYEGVATILLIIVPTWLLGYTVFAGWIGYRKT